MSADRFDTKQRLSLIALVFVAATVVFGASYAVERQNKSELTASVPTASVSSIQETQVLGTQTEGTGAYLVTTGAVESQAAFLRIPVQVTNTSTETVQLSPGLQFKLIGSKTKSVKTIEPPTGATLFAGGPLAAGQTLSGDVYFSSFENETYELAFFPDVEKDEHAIVPMIAQPEVTQSTSTQQSPENKKVEVENETEDD